MADVVQLDPHVNMTVEECISYCQREQEEYQDVIMVAYDADGELIVRSSKMSREGALWLLMEAVDHARGR